FPVHGTWGPRGPSAVPSNKIRARLLEKEIIQTHDLRLNKISASARTDTAVVTFHSLARRRPKKRFNYFGDSRI
ncbi:hypothetical protein, partial [uncultured Rikenella sp.]|uniref:hypothetical protein n=1 Tax=uncultured Rikenella sp. TaxID=368003 RepID=UPI00263094D3